MLAVPLVRTHSKDHLVLLLSVNNILISKDTFFKTLALAGFVSKIVEYERIFSSLEIIPQKVVDIPILAFAYSWYYLESETLLFWSSPIIEFFSHFLDFCTQAKII